jgi:glycosyltransferase involved in cell wall biosynthesis
LKKRVLIITYYWPPSGGPGVQRVLKFVKYLPEFDWEPIVITVKDGEYPALDSSLEKEIDSSVRVYKVQSLELYDLFRKITGKKKGSKIETYELVKGKDQLSWKEKFAQFIRINFLIPDARIGWNLRGYRSCIQIINDEKPDLIFSSSPPHSLQILASRISRKTGIKWVADFRDPWTKSFYDKGLKRWFLADNYNKRLEKKIVTTADCITAVSEGVLDLIGASEAKKSMVISNGYDEDDFQKSKSKNPYFRIVYTGHIASVQNPENFLESLVCMLYEGKSSIRVDIYGSADQIVKDSVIVKGLSDVVTFHPYVAHEVAINQMIDADLLLLLIPRQNSKGILTGKLFEYLATGNFILGIGDEDGIAARVIRKCNAGTMIGYARDPIEMLRTQYERWQQGQPHRGNQEEIAKYSRRNLTKKLADLFNEITK